MTSKREFSAFLLGGVNSGSGKTTLALALLRALARRGLNPAPFKCGPDFIDPLLQTQASGRTAYNLDLWFQSEPALRDCFRNGVVDADVAVVEGVMGLFDGFAPDATDGSSAAVARTLELPVVLVVNARGLSGSIAPLVKGFSEWDPALRIVGVIADFAGSEHHAGLLERALRAAGLPPLLGYLPSCPAWQLPERHLGLDTAGLAAERLDELAAAVARSVDLDRLLALTRRPRPEAPLPAPPRTRRLRLGVARDAAFQFYYEENFALLRQLGVELVEFSPLADRALPPALDGLYFGGGYPELCAGELAANTALLTGIRDFAAAGRPVYGECGGYLYLLEQLTDFSGRSHRLAGLLPGRARMNPRLAALGYRRAETTAPGLFGPAGTRLVGHEFHYSSVTATEAAPPLFRATDLRGGTSPAGSVSGRVAGSYLHLHFAGNPAALAHWVGELAR